MFCTNDSLFFLKLILRFDKRFRFFPLVSHSTLSHLLVADCTTGLSESVRGCLMGSHVAKLNFSNNSAKRYSFINGIEWV